MGAIYLDAGITACQETVLHWYHERLKTDFNRLTHKDAKTDLQEFLQARHYPLPCYTVKNTTGKPHNLVFKVHCVVTGIDCVAIGVGTSRREAEQKAAAVLLDYVTKNASHCL